jgi:hypothetical protein
MDTAGWVTNSRSAALEAERWLQFQIIFLSSQFLVMI